MKTNALLLAHFTESDFVGAVSPWPGRLAENEKLAAQDRNNSVEQFAMGDFKDAFTDIVIEAQDAHNRSAKQLLKDERIAGASAFQRGGRAQYAMAGGRIFDAPSFDRSQAPSFLE